MSVQVYGRSLSALVIGDLDKVIDDVEFHEDDHHDASDEDDHHRMRGSKRLHSLIEFSDNLEAKIVKVDC